MSNGQVIDLGWARINPQGVVLQSEPIAPRYIDYAIKISLTSDGQTHSECVFVNDMDGEVEAIKRTGLTLKEWGPGLMANLKACGDHGPVPTTPEERWARARKCQDIPLPENFSPEKIEKKRCPRCAGGYPKGMVKCTSCDVSFALQMGSTIHYPSLRASNPDLEQSYAIVIQGTPESIWVPSTKAEKQSTASSSTDTQPTMDVTQLSEEAKKMSE